MGISKETGGPKSARSGLYTLTYNTEHRDLAQARSTKSTLARGVMIDNTRAEWIGDAVLP